MRWRATIYYRTDVGLIDVEHELQELADLHDIVENGPSWYAIERIDIRPTVMSTQTI
jgi:hypothetical protein